MIGREAPCRLARSDPLGLGILLAAASEMVYARRGVTPSRGIVAATLLASAREHSWRVPVLANASLYHAVQAGRLLRAIDVLWAAALGALLREARRAERWEKSSCSTTASYPRTTNAYSVEARRATVRERFVTMRNIRFSDD
jgi:hypothetical protein